MLTDGPTRGRFLSICGSGGESAARGSVCFPASRADVSTDFEDIISRLDCGISDTRSPFCWSGFSNFGQGVIGSSYLWRSDIQRSRRCW